MPAHSLTDLGIKDNKKPKSLFEGPGHVLGSGTKVAAKPAKEQTVSVNLVQL